MKLMNAIAKSLVKNFANLGGALVGLPMAGDIVVDVWEYWHKDGDMQKMRAEIEALARQSVQDALKEAQQAVATEAANLPEAVRKQLVDYVSLVPAAIRRSLRRPADHTGLSVPAGLALRKANDLLPFLPAGLPRFKAGDQPLPHTDLQLLELLGQGGFGEVWKARHVDRPKVPLVALKFCLEPSAARTLENERELLDHIANTGKIDGIVQLLYSHLRATPPCLEYELVEGGDLTSLIAELHEQKKPDAGFVARIVLQLTNIVAHAHQQQPPIIHRDLKPANILVRRKDNKLSFKIADFGIGAIAAKKALLDYTTGKTKLAQQRRDTLLGAYTPFYASPEQVSGEFPDPRDDVHALGVIWYQLQTGNLSVMTMPPHWREDLLESGMSQQFVDVLATCISRLKDRPRHAGELAERLEKLLAPPVAIIAPVEPPAPPQPTPPKKHTESPSVKTPKTGQPHGAVWFLVPVLIGVALLFGCVISMMVWNGAFSDGRKEPTSKDYANTLSMKLVRIEPGTFQMGSPAGELNRQTNESQHTVTITKPFYIGKYEVTQEEYESVMQSNPSRFKNNKRLPVEQVSWNDAKEFSSRFKNNKRLPVEQVSWNDAKEFCGNLTVKERQAGKITAKMEYGLPTEAEWEYCCRAGTSTPFHFGNTISTDQANYNGEVVYGNGNKGVYRQKTTEVGSFAANAWGLHDMHGNVWEWCEDCYDKDFYTNGITKDPVCTNGQNRVLRGGSWDYYPQDCRSAYRSSYTPDYRSYLYGFRVVLRFSPRTP